MVTRSRLKVLKVKKRCVVKGCTKRAQWRIESSAYGRGHLDLCFAHTRALDEGALKVPTAKERKAAERERSQQERQKKVRRMLEQQRARDEFLSSSEGL